MRQEPTRAQNIFQSDEWSSFYVLGSNKNNLKSKAKTLAKVMIKKQIIVDVKFSTQTKQLNKIEELDMLIP